MLAVKVFFPPFSVGEQASPRGASSGVLPRHNAVRPARRRTYGSRFRIAWRIAMAMLCRGQAGKRAQDCRDREQPRLKSHFATIEVRPRQLSVEESRQDGDEARTRQQTCSRPPDRASGARRDQDGNRLPGHHWRWRTQGGSRSPGRGPCRAAGGHVKCAAHQVSRDHQSQRRAKGESPNAANSHRTVRHAAHNIARMTWSIGVSGGQRVW
jgi:hypothetical protein